MVFGLTRFSVQGLGAITKNHIGQITHIATYSTTITMISKHIIMGCLEPLVQGLGCGAVEYEGRSPSYVYINRKLKALLIKPVWRFV